MKFIEKIHAEFAPYFIEIGFEESKVFNDHGLVEFYKVRTDSINCVSLTFPPTGIGFVKIRGFIEFPLVSDTLSRFIKVKTFFKEETVINYDLYSDKEKWMDIYHRLSNLPLESPSDIKLFKTEIIAHVDEFILSFFAKFPDIMSVNDIIFNEMSFEEFPNFIPGNCTLKTLIMMDLCANPLLIDYVKVKDEEYRKFVKQNSKMWQPSYDSFLKVTKFLKLT